MAERKTIPRLKLPSFLTGKSLIPITVVNGDAARTERWPLEQVTDFVNEPVAGLVSDASASKVAAAQSEVAAAAHAAIASAAAGTIYATTAAGLAATEPDGFFLVVGATVGVYADLFRHDLVGDTPTAVLQASYPSKAAFDAAVVQVADQAAPAVLLHLPDDVVSSDAAVVHLDDAGRIIAESASVEAVAAVKTRTGRLEDAASAVIHGGDEDVAAEWYDDEGRLIGRAATVEAVRTVATDLETGLADAKVTTTVQVYLPDTYPEVCYFDELGRWIPNVGASGTTSLLKLVHAAGLGDDYRTAPTFWLPEEDVDNGVGIMGQSYAKLGNLGTPYSATPRNPGFALMPAVGVFPDGRPYTAYADLRSSLYFEADGDIGVNETIAPELAATILEIIEARFGEQRRHVFHISARGGQQYRTICRGTAVWNEFLRQVEANVAISRALGRRYVQRVIIWCHGEADGPNTQAWEYKIGLGQTQSLLEAEVKARTGQTEPLKFVCYAPTRNTISGSVRLNGPTIAMRELMRERPEIFTIAGSAYGIRHDETAHPTFNDGGRMLGRMLGIAVPWHVYGTGFRPMDVTRAYWTSDTTIRVELFVPFGFSAFDDRSGDLVGYPSDPSDPFYIGPPPGGQEATGRDGGWRIKDRLGTPFGVVSAVLSGSIVDITTSRAGDRGTTVLSYAARPQGETISGDNTNMARGTLRAATGFTLADSDEVIFPWLTPVELTPS